MKRLNKTNIEWSRKVSSIDQLEEIYGKPNPASLIKEIDFISEEYRKFIEVSPFAVLATVGEAGLDCSPRGDPPGFVKVHDHKTVLLPDRRGNNRLDSLRNLVRDPRCSLLCLIPGVGETIRINGTAELVTDRALREHFIMQGKMPALVIVVTIERIYFQCSKALVRSELWDPKSQISRSELPTIGQMIKGAHDESFDADTFDAAYPARLSDTIY